MPCSCSEIVLDETKPCESHKKCASFCKKNCCPEEELIDCCTPAYLRLEKLTNNWEATVLGSTPVSVSTDGESILGVTTSSGDAIAIPDTQFFETEPYGANGVALATAIQSSCEFSYNLEVELNLAYVAYVFVNALRYPKYAECGKADQLFGWYFDTNTENLEIFQNIPEFGLTPSINRLTLLGISPCSLTKVQKKQLSGLNALYKVSLKALSKAVVPRREGSIVKVTDKAGQVWTVAINSASSTVNTENTQYVVVACPDC
jgi:hypothetical protein